MSDDPIIRQLSKFTPDGAGLDRDAVLFAAGRASARPSRRSFLVMSSLAYALVLSQTITLGMLLSGQGESLFVSQDSRQQISIAVHNFKPASQVYVENAKPDPASYLVMRERLLSEDGSLLPLEPVDSALSDEPPLRAFGPFPSELFH